MADIGGEEEDIKREEEEGEEFHGEELPHESVETKAEVVDNDVDDEEWAIHPADEEAQKTEEAEEQEQEAVHEEVSGDVAAEKGDIPPAALGDEAEGVVGAAGSTAADFRADHVPDTGEVAEIILIATSLGSIHKQFFASQRTKNFLDCKGVVYIIIDSNRDTSSAKNLRDIDLFKDWKAKSILKITPETVDSSDPEIIIPQVLVDGVPVGDETTLQDLEEDGDLDWIFSRAACPNCLHEKSQSALACESCGVTLQPLIPPDYIVEGHVLQMLQGCPYNESEAAAAEGRELNAQPRWGLVSQHSIAADVDFGDLDAEETSTTGAAELAAGAACEAATEAEAEKE